MELPQALENILTEFLEEFRLSSWSINCRGKSASIQIRFQNDIIDNSHFENKSVTFRKISPSYQNRLKRRNKSLDKTANDWDLYNCSESMLDYEDLLELQYNSGDSDTCWQELHIASHSELQDECFEAVTTYNWCKQTITAEAKCVESSDYAICDIQPLPRIYDNLFGDINFTDKQEHLEYGLRRLQILKEHATTVDYLGLLLREEELKSWFDVMTTEMLAIETEIQMDETSHSGAIHRRKDKQLDTSTKDINWDHRATKEDIVQLRNDIKNGFWSIKSK